MENIDKGLIAIYEKQVIKEARDRTWTPDKERKVAQQTNVDPNKQVSPPAKVEPDPTSDSPLPLDSNNSIDPEVLKRFEYIAQRYLNIPTLETQNSDRLDFHDCAVWSIKDALAAAFRAGQLHK